MNNMQVFNNEEFGQVRTVMIEDEPYFVGKDVAGILGYSNTRKALTDHVDNEDRLDGVTIRDSIGREQSPAFINESGLYSLILSSKMPNAKKFKRWVTADILPTIRRHGAYMTAETMDKVLQDPDFGIRLLSELKNEREERQRLELEAEANQPKVLFADSVAASHTSILVGDLAKLLKQNGVDIGQKRLFGWLRQNGYLIKQKGSAWNMPTQRSMEMGLFEVKETVISHADGHTSINKTPKVTGKGQVYFVNKLLTVVDKGEI